jgi:bacillithiol biosynthesis deacetylase BshB2
LEERHVLVIFPHPDDETFATGGTIARFTRQGVPVTVVCGTLGEMGRNMGKPAFATRESLPLIREMELREACRVLGVRDLRLLGLRDKTVEFEDREALADRILDIIREVNPSLILTYYPGYAVHPDHDALGAAVVRAVEKMPSKARPKVHCVAIANNRDELGPPDVEVDVSDVMETKIAAMRAHRSQSEAMLSRLNEMMRDPAQRARWESQRRYERFWVYRFPDATGGA